MSLLAELQLRIPRMYGVLDTHIPEIWSEVKPMIEEALEYADTKYNIGDIKELLKNKEAQLWVFYRNHVGLTGILVTQIVSYPQEKRLLIFLYAGEAYANSQYHFPTIYKFAIEHDCKTVEIYGRPGWEKLLKLQGFEKIHTVLRKKL